jgi:hypothetical protein
LYLDRVEEDVDSDATIMSESLIDHELVFQVVYDDLYDIDEEAKTNEEWKIERWSEIRDKLATYTNHYPYWTWLWVPTTDFSENETEDQDILLTVKAELHIRKRWSYE